MKPRFYMKKGMWFPRMETVPWAWRADGPGGMYGAYYYATMLDILNLPK